MTIPQGTSGVEDGRRLVAGLGILTSAERRTAWVVLRVAATALNFATFAAVVAVLVFWAVRGELPVGVAFALGFLVVLCIGLESQVRALS